MSNFKRFIYMLSDFIMMVIKFLKIESKNPSLQKKVIYRIPIDFTIGGSVQLSFKQNSAYFL